MDDAKDRTEIAEFLRSLNVRVWLNLKKVLLGKRTVNRLDRGVVCVGSAPDPDRLSGANTGTDSSWVINRGDRRYAAVKTALTVQDAAFLMNREH